MKVLVYKITFLVVFLSLSVCVSAALPEDNSIMRFKSTNKDGKTIYAVAMSDGTTVKALLETDKNYKYENTLWLVKVNGSSFTLQNVGTKRFLSSSKKNGYGWLGFLRQISYFSMNTSGESFKESNGKYYIGDYLYAQYDPNENEWRYYQENGDNKSTSQNDGNWSDTTNPPANEEESVVIPGSELGDVVDDEEVSTDKLIGELNDRIDEVEDKEEDYSEFKIVLKAESKSIVVGDESTYPTISYWKQSTIKITTVNNSTWTPVSFPMDVKCITTDISDVYVQTYNTEKRANGEPAWENKLLTSSEVLKRGVAYNIATDKTPNITLEFETLETDGVRVKSGVVSVVDDYANNLSETSGNSLNCNWYYIGNALFLDAKMNNAIDYACQYNGSGYDYVDLEDESFAPFSTFFVQYAGDYAMSSFDATRSSAPMLAREKSATEKYSLRIDGVDTYSKTGIYFADGASVEDYIVGEDFLSFASKEGAGVEIYTYQDDIEYSFNKLPIENAFVRVGVYVGTAGNYTISLNNISGNAETFVLYDNYEDKSVYLHLGEEYTFYSERGEFNDRFDVTITYAPAGPTDNISLSAVNLVVVGNEIQGLTVGADYVIYDSTGRLVYSDVADAATVKLPNLNSGIYIVRTFKGSVKFIVK